MVRLRDTIERTTDYVNFIKSLKEFHIRKGTTLQAEPVLGGKRLDLFKIYQAVITSGGFDEVTKNRGWKQVGDIFQFPSTCTNSAYIIKGVYIRNLLGFEEENIWQKTWEPPKELLGPHAHRASTLAGKTYKVPIKGAIKKPTMKSNHHRSPEPTSPVDISSLIVDTLTSINHTLTPVQQQQQQQQQQQTERKESIKNTTVLFDKETKDKILFALRFGQRSNVEWALDHIVSLSFESPESLQLNDSPYLLDLLLSLAQPCLTTHAVDHILPSAKEALLSMLQDESKLKNSATANILLENISASSSTTLPLSSALSTLDLVLKVFHILRNFSFLPASIPLLISNKLLKDILVQGLETSMSTGHFELGRHSIDVIENLASYTILQSDQDAYLLSLYRLALTQDRYLIIGSVRTLTLFFSIESNRVHLRESPIVDHVTQMLLSSDEELVGTALEYIYQYTCISEECRTQFLSRYAGSYLGLLVTLLMTKSKYFNARTLHGLPSDTSNDDFELPELKEERHSSCTLSRAEGIKGQDEEMKPIPTVPDLTVYHNLDEPFRCLGWLKDKFEVADRSSVLSLDDIYLLYEARFGLEKALKMRDFYTVMKIAFPKASTSESKPLLGSHGKAAPVVEGLNIVGIQIKMSILQDRPAVVCKWDQCSLSFDDTFLLQRHILQSHIKEEDSHHCHWSNCFTNTFDTKDDCIAHLRTHIYNINGESCCPSPILNTPSDTSSSIPSTPTSPSSVFSAATTATTPDVAEIQGIALVAIHLLLWISRDPVSPKYFIPFEKELVLITEQRPKLTSSIWSVLLNLKLS
ncbi:hypothetical protein K501DRAFT_284719 [Backusella circina FSU 941]|nr:hypothetical protein K501DRAFT_284719 [Backusella circina FSU 941]